MNHCKQNIVLSYREEKQLFPSTKKNRFQIKNIDLKNPNFLLILMIFCNHENKVLNLIF